MKIGIVNRKSSFAKHWITFLQANDLDYIEIYSADLVLEKLKELDYFFWHVDHFDPTDYEKAFSIIKQLQKHVITFPSTTELNYFDNKIRQIELFNEKSIEHPLTAISTSKEEAVRHIELFTFPFVAKLKRGAGSDNVWLIENEKQALQHIERSYSTGFSIFNHRKYLKKRISKAKANKSILSGAKGLSSMLKNKRSAKKQPREVGYTFFQEYIPNDGFDIRVVVIDKSKAFSAKRHATKGDWTASGSGLATYPDEEIDTSYIKKAFDIALKLNARCIAIDFVRDNMTGKIYTIEISPFYASYSMEPCKGYWDKSLNWHLEKRDPQWFLMEKVMRKR